MDEHEPLKRNAKGQLLSGQRALNPSGMDRQKQRMLNQLNQLTPRAISRLSKLLDSDDEKVAIVAVKEVLDRNLGKPKASLDVKVEASLSALHLQALEELAQRAHAARAERMVDITPKVELIDTSYNDIVVTRLNRDTIISDDD
jgi:hypothetical protein